MPCKNACAIIDKININIYKKLFHFHLFYLKNARDGHNYLFIEELIKRKI